MNKSLIGMYVNNLTYEDLSKYIDNNYNNVSEVDKKIIFRYIKDRWEDIYKNENNVFDEIKNEVSPSTFIEIVNLYNKYKKYMN